MMFETWFYITFGVFIFIPLMGVAHIFTKGLLLALAIMADFP